MVCPKCGKITQRSYNGLCQGCYKYFKSGGKVYPLPEAGKVEQLVKCHDRCKDDCDKVLQGMEKLYQMIGA